MLHGIPQRISGLGKWSPRDDRKWCVFQYASNVSAVADHRDRVTPSIRMPHNMRIQHYLHVQHRVPDVGTHEPTSSGRSMFISMLGSDRAASFGERTSYQRDSEGRLGHSLFVVLH